MGVWIKPELIVIVRTHPEEIVLAGCKNAGSLGPASDNSQCEEIGCEWVCAGFPSS